MLNSVGAVMVTASFLLFAGGGQAQIQADLSFADTCDMSTLFARIDSLASECGCGTSDCDSESSLSCPTSCLSALLPLLDDCQDVINPLLDGQDGVEDGEYQPLSDEYDQCAAIPPATLIDELKALQDRGQCPPAVLDSVAATEVKAPGCADRWDGNRCSLSIASGIMTCDHDFCNTVYPPCVMAGQCDRSCGLCGDDGSGHRLLLAALQQLRQLQMSHMTCSPSSFEADAAAVDAACCDDEGSCTNGIPGECDAKCAVVFNSFYFRCQRFLASQFSIADMAQYDQLFSTCTRALPAEPLLRALVVCSANPSDPCFGVDCGGHGHCVGGICQCDTGYSGESCGVVFDSCSIIDELYNGISTYCDPTTGGGGWELFLYTTNGESGPLSQQNGHFDGLVRDQQANLNADVLLNNYRGRLEVAFAWASGRGPYTTLDTYDAAISYRLPETTISFAPTTLSPMAHGDNCNDAQAFTAVDVQCLSGACENMVGQMYVGTRESTVCYGYAYGLVRPNDDGHHGCDWGADHQDYTALYIQVVSSPWGDACKYVHFHGTQQMVQPLHMTMWFRILPP